MKTPIAVDDIRAGDLIRWEFDDSEEAGEYRAEYDGDRRPRTAAYFLLDRPTPAVELPTEPTLGWVQFGDGDSWLGIVQPSADPGTFTAALDRGYYSDQWIRESVTAFTPATAVPTEALDALRVFADTSALEFAKAAIYDFLNAITEANT